MVATRIGRTLGTSNESGFETHVLAHLDAAYNLARWLLGNDQDAEDAVQDAAIRALESIHKLRGTNGKSWFLTIVRNTSLNRIRQRNSNRTADMEVDESFADPRVASPHELVIQAWQSEELRVALGNLPLAFREVIILRELEDMSYKEIAEVTALPIGTVMSRLARARERLQFSLVASGAVVAQ